MISGKSVIRSFFVGTRNNFRETGDIYEDQRGQSLQSSNFNLFASQTFTQICTKFWLELQCVSIFRSTTGFLINPFGSTR